MGRHRLDPEKPRCEPTRHTGYKPRITLVLGCEFVGERVVRRSGRRVRFVRSVDSDEGVPNPLCGRGV